MRAICSYCSTQLGEVAPFDSDLISHGMCPSCEDYFNRTWGKEGQRLGEFLDRFQAPVLAVDATTTRTLAANRPMADLLCKRERSRFGLLGDQATECAKARLPGGCGNTVHCRDCTIRMIVAKTLSTGEDQRGVPAYLERAGVRSALTVSTMLRDGVVVVVFAPD